MHKKSSVALKVIVSLLVILILLAGAAEVGLRWFVSKQITDSVPAATDGEKATVGFGAHPLLLGALKQDIAYANVNIPDSVSIVYPDGPDSVPTITGMPKAHITIDGLKLTDPDHPIASTLTVEADVSDKFILAQAQRAMAESTQQTQQQPQDLAALAQQLLSKVVRITDVTSHPETNTLAIEFTGGAAELEVTPQVVDGHVQFEAASASLLGFDMPEGVTQALTDGLKNSAQDVGGELAVKEFMVTHDGLLVTMVGHDVDLNELQG